VGDLKHDHEILIKRYNSICEGAAEQSKQICSLMNETSALKAEIVRLGAELKASQANVQLLGNDYNERSRLAGSHIEQLRTKLKANGINPEVN